MWLQNWLSFQGRKSTGVGNVERQEKLFPSACADSESGVSNIWSSFAIKFLTKLILLISCSLVAGNCGSDKQAAGLAEFLDRPFFVKRKKLSPTESQEILGRQLETS